MKIGYKLSLLAVAALMASCNEKVSPELQEGSTDSGSTVAIPPSTYYFRVVDQSATLLNYKVHKTGDGNANTKCQVTNTTGLSSEIFVGDEASNDITCFMEAEELSLHYGGFDLAIEASKNTCDYVGYQPYGFYNYQPGSSSGSYNQITCGDGVTAADVISVIDPATLAAAGNDLHCGYMLSEDIAAVDRKRFASPENDQELCRFDYSSSEGPNCDTGRITITEYQVAVTPETDNDPRSVSVEPVQKTIECGGKIYNCVTGPTKEIRDDATRVTAITQSEINKNVSLSYEYASPNSMEHSSNLFYVNYRRDLASKYIDYVSQDTAHNSTYRAAFDGIKTFDPEVMDYYSSNLMHDNSTALITNGDLAAEAIKNNKWTATPLAAEPYMGLAGKVNPFYTFYCFDTAFDVKARIRLAIREWDRIYPNSTQVEYLSDIFYTGASKLTARQDIPGEFEVPDNNDPYIPYNDLLDWDDFISMDRTEDSTTSEVAFDEDETVWRPTPLVNADPAFDYSDGWFNPANFPGSLK